MAATTAEAWGWAQASTKALRKASGSLHWRQLRDAMVARFQKAHPEGTEVCEETLGWIALASLPEQWLSRERDTVSLPACESDDGSAAEGQAPAAKRRRQGEDGAAAAAAEAGEADVPAAMHRAHVSELPFAAGLADIQAHFAPCGELAGCELLLTDKKKSRGIAFISFAEASGLEAALELDGVAFQGAKLKVARAKGTGKRPSTAAAKGKAKDKKRSPKDRKRKAEEATGDDDGSDGAAEGKGKEKGKGKGKGKEKGKGKGKGKDKGKGKGKGKDGKGKDGKGEGRARNPEDLEDRQFEVFVGGLPFHVEEARLRSDFSELGETGRFKIPLAPGGKEHTGIAFVNYRTKEGMDAALALHETLYEGVTIRVQRAIPPRGPRERPTAEVTREAGEGVSEL